MKRSKLAAAVLAVSAAGTSFAADLGTLNLSSGSTFFGNTPTSLGFADFVTFTLGIAGTFNGSVTSVVNGTQDVDFSYIALTGPSGLFTFSQLNADPVEVWASPGAGWFLNAGTYTMTLIGTNSASMGSYAANVAVTPVPEPETLAMFLAGGGVLGFLARRRRV